MPKTRAAATDLFFVPLGGLGEIGMNCALYGLGGDRGGSWLLVDLGVTFGDAETPGIDLVLPDLSFIERERRNLAGIVITHAHEDHFGALAELWPKLGAPVFMTPFAAALLEARRLSEPSAPRLPITVVKPGDRVAIGGFDVEFIPVAHSVPEACALAIRTAAGLIVHSGDWKLDPEPIVGDRTAAERFRALGDEGVLGFVNDSTNVFRDSESPSEGDVGRALADLMAQARGRVAVTLFASNVARIRAIAQAAATNGREVVVVGRAIGRVVQVARDLGYLDGLPAFRRPDTYGYLPRDKVVALLTGSQGEARAALARVARDDHPEIALSSGDTVVFSSRTIPGNEKAVGAIINELYRRGIGVITDRTHLVHVSGHPRRGEMAEMYGWVRPKVAVPAHGEPAHLTEHEAFARALGVPHVIRAFNGDVVRFTGVPEVADHVTVGRRYKDGSIAIGEGDATLPERRKLAFAGVVSVAVTVSAAGTLVADPEVQTAGLPPRTPEGQSFDAFVLEEVEDVMGNLPARKLRDPDAIRETLVKSIRGAVNELWGKKPLCHVLVQQVEGGT